MTRVFVFDLDNTLFDTRSIPSSVTDDLFQRMRDANVGADAVSASVLERAFHDSWSIPFTVVASTHGLSERLMNAWTLFHETLTFPEPLNPFPDVMETLLQLRERQCVLLLLTSGYQRVQLAKIEALRIGTLFDQILIDAIDVSHRGKEAILAELLAENKWLPSELVIVGDSAASEIAAGIRLGIPTVQILRPGVQRADIADRHIVCLSELLGIFGAV